MYGYLMKLRAETLRDLGAALAPLNAFLFMQGLETLPLRMKAHVANAAAVARFLARRATRRTRALRGSRRQPVSRACATNTCRAAPAPCSVSISPAGATPDARSSRALTSLFAPRERRRREEPRDPSGQHDAPATRRCGTDGRRHRPRHDPAVDRHRRRRRSDLGSANRVSRRSAR